MESINLFSLREELTQMQILLCFNGPISEGLLEDIGIALKRHMQTEQQPSLSLDVFGVYIELTQNIRHYAKRKNYSEAESSATVIVARENEHYHVLAGNLVELEDAEELQKSISKLAVMDKIELKAAYKEQLRKPREMNASSGAGLGLLDVARRSSKPLTVKLTNAENRRAFFCILAVI